MILDVDRRLRGVAVKTRLVPSDLGATGMIDSLRDWAAEHEEHCGAGWLTAPLPEEPPLTGPWTVDPDGASVFAAALDRFQTLACMRAERCEVAVLPGARLVTSDGMAIAHDGMLAGESAWDEQKIEQSGVMLMHRIPRVSTAPGAYASLISQWCEVYYHWLSDVLPRLRILEATGCGEIPLIVPAGLTAWQRRSLELLGVAPGRLTPYRGVSAGRPSCGRVRRRRQDTCLGGRVNGSVSGSLRASPRRRGGCI